VRDSYLSGAVWSSESERILLRQVGWMRRMLRRTVEVYGRDDKWLRGHLITLREAVSKRHPILKRFYMETEVALDRGYETLAEAIKDELDTVGYVTAGALGEAVGMTSSSVRKIIARMIEDGYAVVATREGFKLARDAGELLKYQRDLLGRADEITRRAMAIGEIAADFVGGWRA
jgi:biotin operon repressor